MFKLTTILFLVSCIWANAQTAKPEQTIHQNWQIGLQASAQENKRPIDYADVFIGTSNSRWMLGPYASTPMGMVQLGPDNQGDVWMGG